MPDRKYSAPALEKGLDILELLAARKRPLTISQMSTEMDRSVSELFRMVQVLEDRGYVSGGARGEGFELTNKLFSLGMSRGPSHNLLTTALPLMQKLSTETQQSCHLVIASESQMVVIARIEAPGDLGFSVRVGYQRPLVHSTSGIVLYAHQPDEAKADWHARLSAGEAPEVWSAFEAKARLALEQGYAQSHSEFVEAITDVSCPVFSDAGVIAALTMPHLTSRDSASLSSCIAALKETVRDLSTELGGQHGV